MIRTAFILAAGHGTRMRPWTHLYPKPMLTLGNTPLILWHLEQLFDFGVRHFLVNMHHLSHKLHGFLEFHFRSLLTRGARLTLLEEEQILGTGGALFQAGPHVLEEHFFLVNADIIHRIDLGKAALFHEERSPLATLLIKQTEDPSWKKVALEPNGTISQLAKNIFTSSPSEIAFGFTGIHVLSRKIFSYCLEKKYQCIVNDLYPQGVKNGEKIFGFETQEYWKDLGHMDQFAEAHRDLLSGKIIPPIGISKTS